VLTPVVFNSKASLPTAVAPSPVLALKALYPTAVLAVPVILASKAKEPTATFNVPVVFEHHLQDHQ
jgi:hypothetical protein